MYKKIVLLAFMSALLLLATFGIRITIPVSGSTRDVNPGQSIQDAINSANPGDTILVPAGTYYEHVVVNKTVTLIGDNPANTIIDGNGTGIVVRIRASNVTIRGFTIQNGGIFGVDCGIYVTNHTETISNNVIRNNCNGIWLQKSNGNNITDNLILNNTWGVHIAESNESIIHDNTIANNTIGVWITSNASVLNTFYHNNFIDNENQVSAYGSAKWDNGTEGNYWSDYTGLDDGSDSRVAGDGVGDTDLPHLVDFYPLIIPTRPFPVVVSGIIYPVALLSNSTVSRFYFSQPLKRIGFNVTGPSGTIGFCNITIPLTLMWCDQPEEWQVTLGGNPPAYFPTPTNNGTHTFLYFTYNQGAHNVKIISTHVVPEFPAAIVLSLFIIFTLVAVILKKRKEETFKL